MSFCGEYDDQSQSARDRRSEIMQRRQQQRQHQQQQRQHLKNKKNSQRQQQYRDCQRGIRDAHTPEQLEVTRQQNRDCQRRIRDAYTPEQLEVTRQQNRVSQRTIRDAYTPEQLEVARQQNCDCQRRIREASYHDRISQSDSDNSDDEEEQVNASLSVEQFSIDMISRPTVNQLAVIGNQNVAPPLLLIHGAPGTGKSFIVDKVVEQAISLGVGTMSCAFTGAAATNLVDGMTILSMFGIQMSEPGTNVALSPLPESKLNVFVSCSSLNNLIKLKCYLLMRFHLSIQYYYQ